MYFVFLYLNYIFTAIFIRNTIWDEQVFAHISRGIIYSAKRDFQIRAETLLSKANAHLRQSDTNWVYWHSAIQFCFTVCYKFIFMTKFVFAGRFLTVDT